MEFRNLTPFPALSFPILDADDQEHRCTVLRVTYRIEPKDDGNCALVVQDEEPPPLCVEDRYEGEMNRSSVLEESDLAPWKPACDVIVNGMAHAPQEAPARSFTVNLKVCGPETAAPMPLAPQGLNPFMPPSLEQTAEWERACARAQASLAPGVVFLDKSLEVMGERFLRKKSWPFRLAGFLLRVGTLGLARSNPWKLTWPAKFVTLPIRYEHAFGGECRVNWGDERAEKRVPNKNRLTQEQAASHIDASREATQQPVAHTFCAHNPVGTGFAEAWYLEAIKAKRIPAPRIQRTNAPLTAKLWWNATRGKQKQPHPALEPAGLGFVGRSWPPRIQLAGTWDETWVKERHPFLPNDFDFGYWNGAPADQQIPYPPPDAAIHLTNLTPSGKLAIRLPGHRAFVACRWLDGEIEAEPMFIDTLLVDTEAMTLTVVWRSVLPEDEGLRVIEARFEMDPAKPLLRWAEDAATCPLEAEVAS